MKKDILIRSKHYRLNKITLFLSVFAGIIFLILITIPTETLLSKAGYVLFAMLLLSLCFMITIVSCQLFCYTIFVTETCIYAFTLSGKYISLPIESITYIKTSCCLRTIHIGTPTKEIRCKLVKNQLDIYCVISCLLTERWKQKKPFSNIS